MSVLSKIFRRRPSLNLGDDSDSGTSTDELDADSSSISSNKSQSCPGISRLYADAAAFENVLKCTGCIDKCADKFRDRSFAHLIGKDLTDQERAVALQDATLDAAVNSWVPDAAESPNSKSLLEGDDELVAHPFLPEAPLPVIRRAATVDIDRLSDLGPQEIVQILIDEFGPLAQEGEDESLLLEADGCILHEVAVIGVIHLTTHRLAFHASLLATRPDLGKSTEVIKAGPATCHRKGWRTKRRVWLELTTGMICSYASSEDEDRSRPLTAILLTLIRLVPVDPKHPRILRAIRDVGNPHAHNYLEFDTEESAIEWRKEIQGALFMSQHRKREMYANSAPDEDNGVRLSLPLNRICRVRRNVHLDLPTLVALDVRPTDSDNCSTTPESFAGAQTLQIGPVVHIPIWDKLDGITEVAKARSRQNPHSSQFPFIVDFGPLSFCQSELSNSEQHLSNASLKDKAIRNALGFNNESELWIASARIYRTLTNAGYFVTSQHHIGFWSKNLTKRDVKYRISTSQVTYTRAFHLNWVDVVGLTIGIQGQSDLKLVFKNVATRDEARRQVNQIILGAQTPSSPTSAIKALPSDPSESLSLSPTSNINSQLSRNATGIIAPLSRSVAAATTASGQFLPNFRSRMPKAINLPREFLVSNAPLHFVCLTIGSRGDVQPYIALGIRLKKEGHRVTIITHEEYHDWIVGFGLEHKQAGGDPGRLMKLSVENKIMSPDFFRESMQNFRPWLDDLLEDAWVACQGADVLLESPSAMAGVHIAEALKIPYFRTFSMPWTKTTAFPHPFLSPPVGSPTFNSASYVLFNNVMWGATSKQINKWRRISLKIGTTDMGHLSQSKITFIYNFSPSVVPKPLDWPDSTTISGYWFLANPDLGWAPSQGLLNWMAQARSDGKPIVYIGFGSITVPRPKRVTARIVRAVLISGVRAIISKGWSARMSSGEDNDPDVEIPPECFVLDKVPHDWLFARIDAAVHHGGAGTTHASLRAGIPTIIKPWFGDQFFWASRVRRLGAGLKVSSLKGNLLAEALVKATTDVVMREKAISVGQKIRAEDGVHTAIYTIYTYLHRASQDRASLDKH